MPSFTNPPPRMQPPPPLPRQTGRHSTFPSLRQFADASWLIIFAVLGVAYISALVLIAFPGPPTSPRSFPDPTPVVDPPEPPGGANPKTSPGFAPTPFSPFPAAPRRVPRRVPTVSSWKQILKGHTEGVQCVAWSPTGQQILTGSWDRTLIIWEIATGQKLRILRGHQHPLTCAKWSPDGTSILSVASSQLGGQIKLWDVDSGKLRASLEAHNNWVNGADWSPDSKKFVTASDDQTLIIWDAPTGKNLATLNGHTSPVRSVAWSPDGKRIVSGSAKQGQPGILKIWDATTRECQRTIPAHQGPVESIAWSPDGTRLVSGSEDQTLKIWDAASGQVEWTLRGHTGSVYGVGWSLNGKRVVSASVDTTVKVWAAEKGTLLVNLQGHSGSVHCVVWGPQGILSGSADRTVIHWVVRSTQQLVTFLSSNTQLDSPDGREIRVRLISGEKRSFLIENAATVVVDGQMSKLEALHPGWQIALTSDEAGRVVQIKATRPRKQGNAEQLNPVDLIPSEAALAVCVPDLEELLNKPALERIVRRIPGWGWVKVKPLVDSWLTLLSVDPWFDRRRPLLAILKTFNEQIPVVVVPVTDIQAATKALTVQADLDLIQETPAALGILRKLNQTPLLPVAGGLGRIAQAAMVAAAVTTVPGAAQQIHKHGVFRYCLVWDRWIYLAPHKAGLRELVGSPGIGYELSPLDSERLNSADVLIVASGRPWQGSFRSLARGLLNNDVFAQDPASKAAAEKLKTLAEATRLGALGVRVLEEGLSVELSTVFDPGRLKESSLGFCKGLGTSSLQGLPMPQNRWHPVLAYAGRGVGRENGVFYRAVLRLGLAIFPDATAWLDLASRERLTRLLSQAWEQIAGSRAAVYLRFGAYRETWQERLRASEACGFLVLDMDAQQFLKELPHRVEEINTFAHKLAVKTGTPRVQLVYTPQAETVAGITMAHLSFGDLGVGGWPLDVFHMKDGQIFKGWIAQEWDLGLRLLELVEMPGKSPYLRGRVLDKRQIDKQRLLDPWIRRGARAAYEARVELAQLQPILPQLLGPNWYRIRVVPVEQHVVLQFGEDNRLLEDLVTNLREGRPGLAAGSAFAHSQQHLRSSHNLALHIDLERCLKVMDGKGWQDPVKLGESATTSLGFTVNRNGLSLDFWFSETSLLRVIETINTLRVDDEVDF